MEIGVALPQMAVGLDRQQFLEWCSVIDNGPFSSISAGERITFHNLDGFSLCAGAAIATSKVRVLVNVVVVPWHQPAMLAKQLASIDVLSGGRLEIAVGIGGRSDDYTALGVSDRNRHQRLDEGITELRRLWSQGAAADGAPVGPKPTQPGGPRVLASAMGPKALARAAVWADGLSGFSLLADPEEMKRYVADGIEAWTNANRETRPRMVTGTFVALGDNAPTTLREFGRRYLEVFSPDLADALSKQLPVNSPEALNNVLSAASAAGYDEFIIVPASVNPDLAGQLTDSVQAWISNNALDRQTAS